MDSGAISWDHITLHLWKGKLGEQEEKQEEAESEQCYRRHSKNGRRPKTYLQRRHTGGHEAHPKMCNITNSLLLFSR